MNIDVDDFSFTNAALLVNYHKDNVAYVESFPIETFELFITSNDYLAYHDFRIKHDNQYEEIDGHISWERYISEFVSTSDVCDFVKAQLKIK